MPDWRAHPRGTTTAAGEPLVTTPLPGPRARALVERDARVLSPSFTRPYPLVVERASGCWVTDVDGNRFLDFTAGIAVTATGHAHPSVVAAIVEQASRFLHMSGTDFLYEPEVALAERLLALAPVAPGGRAFFTNSGAEAIEGAIKLARWATGRPHLLAFTGAFHGRTLGALSLTASRARQRQGFAPLLPGVYHAPFPPAGRGTTATDETLEAVAEIFRTLAEPASFAAVFVEPIQGEGGVVVPPDDFLPRPRALTREHGILLVVDEVQTGIGRTGRMFALEHAGVEADIVTVAKGLASGLPLGAILAGREVMSWPPGAHGTTFGGNPVCCAAALATLDLVEGGLADNAARMGARLLRRLSELAARHPATVSEARGRGLMAAIECRTPELARRVVAAAFERGLLVLPAGARAVRLTPALVVSGHEVDLALDLLEQALSALESTPEPSPA
ncbi:MAG TPA: acetyl ornithine aminotransferase family protein [Candidatus Dormibacteraeota bacterium]|nr:acetyl ornithine aminotransferase family protein [Candidatus Dormibacteraeota bacterium]